MSEHDPPLFAGSILGLRSWPLRAAWPTGVPLLGAAVADGSWEPGGVWTEARCRPLSGGRGSHSSPRPGCTCGLYAFHPGDVVAHRLWIEHIGGGGGIEPSDPDFVEMVGLFGVVEAVGAIEVHELGFRAECARPVALFVGHGWSRRARRDAEELAGRYKAELREIGEPEDALAFCRERGGALDRPQVDRLLEDLEARPLGPPRPPAGSNAAGPPATVGSSATLVPPPATPAPQPAPASRWGRFRSKAAEILVRIATGMLCVLLVAWCAQVVVALVGGIFFGLFDEEPVHAPAEVLAVQIDRERCAIGATIDAERPLEHLNLGLNGHLRNGDPLDKAVRKVGPIKPGVSRVQVVEISPKLCNSRHHFTVRVRPKWKSVTGGWAEVESLYRGPPASGSRGEPRADDA